MDFIDFRNAVSIHFDQMAFNDLFQVEIDRDEIWRLYLDSFPEGSNPMFRERTEHDCSACKSFVRTAGGIVSIKGNKLTTIWDVDVKDPYKTVCKALSEYVCSKAIENIFLHFENRIGVTKNFEVNDEGLSVEWNHLYANLPKKAVAKKDGIGRIKSGKKAAFDVFHRGMQELTVDSLETVIDLIKQGSLYRGEQNLAPLQKYLKLKRGFDKAKAKDLYCWTQAVNESPAITTLRNSSIGTLLIDLSEGKDLTHSVNAYERMVAPSNYKRPKALITKGMIKKAQEKVEELGLTGALNRRYAKPDDITINNVLFANFEAKKTMGVFDALKADCTDKKPSYDKIEDVSIGDFIENILPKADSLSLFVDNDLEKNLMTLVAPQDENAKHLFQWPNNFSWAYKGDVTDSIKERVKSAGGDVSGYIRVSLAWFNSDDLDLHIKEPKGGDHIYFSWKKSRRTLGKLDVDMNAGAHMNSVDPVENIVYPRKDHLINGVYKVIVNNYLKRSRKNVGFVVEIEIDGKIKRFPYSAEVKNKEDVHVADISVSENKIEVKGKIPDALDSKEVWGIKTNAYQKVSMMMLSPNCWDDKQYGNKHYFFMLEDCQAEEEPRGFFNEFLGGELIEHRKVFEVLGSKMSVEESDNQLSGLGFSSTIRDVVLCKVEGTFNRVVRIKF